MSDLAHRTFTSEEQGKIKELIKEGVKVLIERETLNGGLKDAVKAIAEQLDVKPKLLNGAIRAAYKQNLQDRKNECDDLEELMVIAGFPVA